MIARKYYQAFAEKNFAEMEKYLHPEVEFKSPVTALTGSAALMQTIRHLAGVFEKLTIRHASTDGNESVVIYDLHFPAPIGKAQAAALVKEEGKLIKSIELIFDARPFIPK